MHGVVVRNPQGTFSVKFSGNVTELSYIDELKRWASSRDIEVEDQKENEVDYKTIIKMAAQQNPKRLEKEDIKKNQNVTEFWHKFYEILKEKYPDIAKPGKVDVGELVAVDRLLKDYGDQLTLEIYKVAVYDWAALKTLHPKLPFAPTLKNVLFLRRELSIGVANKGITTSQQRVSEYGKETTSAGDGWDAINDKKEKP